MKTKILIISFSLMFIFLTAFIVIKKTGINNSADTKKQAKIVTPKYTNDVEKTNISSENQFDSETFTSVIQLEPTETLISSLSLDFDGDTYDDQILVVRKAGSPYLFVIPVLYSTQFENYERAAEISTEISKIGTFSYTSMDILGNHQQALVFQGVKDDNNSIMQIYICKKDLKNKQSKVEISLIGSFESDGTVFIQQAERSESYEMNASNGEPFTVWVYSSEKNENNEPITNPNQVQTEYKWNKISQVFEPSKSITVTAGRLVANELSKIQDGTVETFASYLDGLWYKTSNSGNTIRYLFFNYKDKEVVFLNDDTEEVFTWEDSKIRHNGIYITTSNSIISSYHRRFNITLKNIDEINAFIIEDLKMQISEDSPWDGTYKKAEQTTTISKTAASDISLLDSFKKALPKKIWKNPDYNQTLIFSDFNYSITEENSSETGIYSIFAVSDHIVLQFRPQSGHSSLFDSYDITFGTKIISETVKRKTVEKTVPDENKILLTPAKITPTDALLTEGKILTFSTEQ